MITRMLILMIIWCQDEVCKLRVNIIWVIINQDHVIGRFHDHDIIIKYKIYIFLFLLFFNILYK